MRLMRLTLQAVSWLLEPSVLRRVLDCATLVETLSQETRVPVATRLALVALAASSTAVPIAYAPPSMAATQVQLPERRESVPDGLRTHRLARELQRLAGAAEADAVDGLVNLAPLLRTLVHDLEQEHSPYSAAPRALLELLRAHMH